MVGGFNYNVPYRGRMFHVQTEHSRRGDPQIVTLLYEGGAILHSEKLSYDAHSAASGDETALKELMEARHLAMLRSLKDGGLDEVVGFDDAPTPGSLAGTVSLEFGAGVVTDARLDDLVLAHLSRQPPAQS